MVLLGENDEEREEEGTEQPRGIPVFRNLVRRMSQPRIGGGATSAVG